MKKVLIIEDDRILSDLLSELLEIDDIECVAVNSVSELLENWNAIGGFSVILLDIMMIRNGLKGDVNEELETGEIIYKKIRESFPKKQVVMISAKDLDSMVIDFKHEPNVRILQKPLDEADFNELTKIIRLA